MEGEVPTSTVDPDLYNKIFPPKKPRKEHDKGGRPRIHTPEEKKQLNAERSRLWQEKNPERLKEIQSAYYYRKKEKARQEQEAARLAEVERIQKLEEEVQRLRQIEEENRLLEEENQRLKEKVEKYEPSKPSRMVKIIKIIKKSADIS